MKTSSPSNKVKEKKEELEKKPALSFFRSLQP